jgi:hypothetical protein
LAKFLWRQLASTTSTTRYVFILSCNLLIINYLVRLAGSQLTMQPTITLPSKWSESSLTHQEKNGIPLSIVFGEHCVWLASKLFLLIFVQHFSRCMEHALHLAAKHFMEDAALTLERARSLSEGARTHRREAKARQTDRMDCKTAQNGTTYLWERPNNNKHQPQPLIPLSPLTQVPPSLVATPSSPMKT